MMKKEPLPDTPVLVTSSTLPAEETYLACVRKIFSSKWLTNNGAYVQNLEQALKNFLAVPELCLCTNGTVALQLALRLLGLNGKKVVTTPFTYVATLSALLWEGCTPIFADIDPHTLNIDPLAVERCLQKHPDAEGIVPVHVYGNACDVDALDALAKRHGLRVLYDAAHAFGSKLHGKSLFTYGDAATGSFHATKLFHTVEGGCVVAAMAEAKEKLCLLRAFGHIGDVHTCLGINAKMSELHAAMGLCLLPEAPDMLTRRASLAARYDAALGLGGSSPLRRPALAPGLEWNHAYYPVILPNNTALLKVLAALESQNIFARRYFYPSVNTLPYVAYQCCPVAEDMAERVLCLPFWPEMPLHLIDQIAQIIINADK